MANLSSDLQASIDNLQTEHTKLVQAVRDYTGGSVASATNDLLAEAVTVGRNISLLESTLIGMISPQNLSQKPTVLLDFKNQVYLVNKGRGYTSVDPLEYLNVESYSGNGSVVDASGRIVPGEGSGLRYTHDPVTGELQGTLVEGFSNNYVLSQDFESGYWNREHVTIGEAQVDGPVEGVPVYKMTASSDSVFRSLRLIRPPEGVTTDASFSIFMKAGNYSFSKMQVNIQDAADAGINVNLSDGSYETYGSVRYAGTDYFGDGWWRVWLAVDGTPAGQAKMAWLQSTAVENQDYIYISAAQIENRFSPTTFMYGETEGDLATRNSDIYAIIPDGELNSRQGTFVFSVYPRAIHGNLWLCDTLAEDGSTYDPYAIRTGGVDMANYYAPHFGNIPTPEESKGRYMLENLNKIKMAIGFDTNTGAGRVWINGEMQEELVDISQFYQPMHIRKVGFGRWLSGGQFSSCIWESIIYYPYLLTESQGNKETTL